MKTFKSLEELIEFVGNQENIETLESGEVILKEWNEDAKALEKFKKEHGAATTDQKALRSQKDELAKKVTELTEQLDSVNNELTGLKEVHSGSDKEALQKLIKEKSDLLTKQNVAESKIRDLEKQVSLIPDLEKQVESYKAASNRSRIFDAVKKAAVARKVPQNIIDDPDFEEIAVNAFIIDDMGNIFTKGDSPQSVDSYILAKQKDRPHWMPVSQGGSGSDPIRPMSGGGTVSDELAAIASLFS
jgi:ribosome-binding ATPase YchF (GTP1/OBG family)